MSTRFEPKPTFGVIRFLIIVFGVALVVLFALSPYVYSAFPAYGNERESSGHAQKIFDYYDPIFVDHIVLGSQMHGL